MPKHTLFAYVDGSDLHEIAGSVEGRLNAFAAECGWRIAGPVVVNQRSKADGLRAGDPPSWDLGLNLTFPDVGYEPEGWFTDVERIAHVIGLLHGQFKRDFVIGIVDNESGVSRDLFTVDAEIPDLAELRRIVGVEPPAGV